MKETNVIEKFCVEYDTTTGRIISSEPENQPQIGMNIILIYFGFIISGQNYVNINISYEVIVLIAVFNINHSRHSQ